MPNLVIDLSTLLSDFFGMIVPYPSPITWTNQCGGTACVRPRIQGFFVPLPIGLLRNACSMEDRAFAHDESAKEFLEDNKLTEFFEVLPSSPPELHEAWIHVRVKEKLPIESIEFELCELLQPLAGREVILTYPNSD